MLLKMNTGLGGPHYNLVGDDEHDFSDPFEARRLVRAGFARPANEEVAAILDALPQDEPTEATAAAAAQAEADAAAAAAAQAEADAATKADAKAEPAAKKAKSKG